MTLDFWLSVFQFDMWHRAGDVLTLGVLALFLLLALPWAVALARHRSVDLMSPTIIVTLVVLVGYVLPIRQFLAGGDALSTSWRYPLMDHEIATARAVWVAALGLAGFYAGHFISTVRRTEPLGESRLLSQWNTRNLQIVCATYTIAAVLLFVLGVYLAGGPTYFLANLGDRIRLTAGLNYFIAAINLLPCTVMLWLSYLLSNDRRIPMAFWLYTAMAAGFTALQGGKSVLLVPTIAALTMYHVRRRRLRVLPVLAGALLVVIAFGAYDVVAREYLAVGRFVTVDPFESVTGTVEHLLNAQLGGNFLQLQTLALVLEVVPEVIPFQAGYTYLALVTAPVPRSIWPDKILPAPGIFTLALWPDRWLKWGTTMPVGLMGELYMNFGLIGVPAGMCLFGWALGAIYHRLRNHSGEPFRLISGAVIVGCIVHYIRGDVYGPTVLCLLYILPTFVGLRLICRHGGTVR